MASSAALFNFLYRHFLFVEGFKKTSKKLSTGIFHEVFEVYQDEDGTEFVRKVEALSSCKVLSIPVSNAATGETMDVSVDTASIRTRIAFQNKISVLEQVTIENRLLFCEGLLL